MAYLSDYGRLEADQHHECKHGIIPVLVQTPETDAKHLKDEEWRHSMLLEQFLKCRKRNIKTDRPPFR